MSGYTFCACRDCFDIAIGEPNDAMCVDCEDAVCVRENDDSMMPSWHRDCQRPDAYGAEEDYDDFPEPEHSLTAETYMGPGSRE